MENIAKCNFYFCSSMGMSELASNGGITGIFSPPSRTVVSCGANSSHLFCKYSSTDICGAAATINNYFNYG